MWLLDHNLPRQVFELFRKLNIPAETVHSRAWETLENGELVQDATTSGFASILTKDVRFRDSTANTLKQDRGPKCAEAFEQAWHVSPIVPVAGQLIVWP